jgi:nicotinamide-nucleotide amidase
VPHENEAIALRIARTAMARGCTIAVAESLTGGALSARLARLPDAGAWYRGAVVAYSTDVKRDVLAVPPGPVVSEPAALALADRVAELLHADVALAVTGVGGPDVQDGVEVGTVWMALHRPEGTVARGFRFGGEPDEVVGQTCDAAVRWLADDLDD